MAICHLAHSVYSSIFSAVHEKQEENLYLLFTWPEQRERHMPDKWLQADDDITRHCIGAMISHMVFPMGRSLLTACKMR